MVGSKFFSLSDGDGANRISGNKNIDSHARLSLFRMNHVDSLKRFFNIKLYENNKYNSDLLR